MGKLVKGGFQGTMDLGVQNAINVYTEDESYIKFFCVHGVLYCVNLDNNWGYTNFPTTLLDKKEQFSDVDNKEGALARYSQEYLYLLSDAGLADTIDNGCIQEFRIGQWHIKIANIIFGLAKATVEASMFRE